MVVRSVIAAALVLSSISAAVAANDGHVSGFVLVALNPQPEPPGITSVADSVHVTSKIPRVSLNPQPEPPGITDGRRLPPGPCRSLVVSVAAPGAPVVTAHAAPTRVSGKCSYDVAVPGARLGATARVTITRER